MNNNNQIILGNDLTQNIKLKLEDRFDNLQIELHKQTSKDIIYILTELLPNLFREQVTSESEQRWLLHCAIKHEQ